MIAAIAVLLAAHVALPDRAYEGDWYIFDTTDNNSGEREVHATRLYVPSTGADFVQIELRCSDGKPSLFVEWEEARLPDKAVLTIGIASASGEKPEETRYIFDKPKDQYRRGLQAPPDTSAGIISAIGLAKYITLTAYASSGVRSVGMEVDGTDRAWSRVVRHCPIRVLPLPPL